MPFISADDIAAVAFHALTDAKVPGETVRVLGPELLTYDEVCFTLTKSESLSNESDVSYRPQQSSPKLLDARSYTFDSTRSRTSSNT